jgi:hypothetical protein
MGSKSAKLGKLLTLFWANSEATVVYPRAPSAAA